MIRFIHISFVSLFLFTAIPVKGQDKKITITLKDAIDIGKDKGQIAKQIKSNYLSNYWHYNAYKASKLPQLRAAGNIPGLNRKIVPITQPDGTVLFILQSQSISNSSVILEQPLTLTGGSIFATSDLYRYNLLGNSTVKYWQSSPLSIGISQPISGFNELKWINAQEKLRMKQATKQEIEAFEDLSIDITQAYFDFYIASIELNNSKYNEAINDTLYKIAKGRFDIGKIAENELLQIELQVMNAKNSVAYSEVKLITTEKKLKILLGLTDETSLEVLPSNNIPLFEVDLVKAQNEAKENRSDYVTYELQKNSAKIELKRAEVSRHISGNLSASYGLNQTGNAFSDVYNNPLNSQQISFSFNMPIINWGKARYDYRSAQYAYDKQVASATNLEQNLDLDIITKVLEIKQLKNSLLISAKADTIAKKRYEVSKNRYLIGKIDITNLTIAQNEKDQALVNYIRNIQSFWIAYYQLRRVTLYDFEKNQKI